MPMYFKGAMTNDKTIGVFAFLLLVTNQGQLKSLKGFLKHWKQAPAAAHAKQKQFLSRQHFRKTS